MLITLTTDFGLGEYVAQMKGVILAINPEASIIDISHNVRPHSVREGAYVMYSATPFFPFAAHVGVVDPGVGTERKAIVVVCEGAMFVGPDNGLLIPAARRFGIKEVREIRNENVFRREISSTFHGRDIFAPVAAHLSLGEKVATLGPVLQDWVDLDFGLYNQRGREFIGEVIFVDRFGNLISNISGKAVLDAYKWGDLLSIDIDGKDYVAPFVRSYGFSRSHKLLATISSSGFLEVALTEGSAANHTGATEGSSVRVGSKGGEAK